MSNQGDDCYFFYYSTCAKGDGCPFRHCEAAMGSETVCNLWQENRCFRKVCKFRHMEIEKRRSEIACYWERQPAGCQKPNCAFHHDKPRIIDGVFLPASKAPVLRKEEVEEEAPLAALSPPAPTALPSPANPQLRGVIKAENSESVPSPTHPPVVINPADDEDEDDDDQFSEEGEESRTAAESSQAASPRKMLCHGSREDSLNFGIKTLEEIRLRKTLKANLKRSGQSPNSRSPPANDLPHPAQQNNGTSLEKESARTVLRPALLGVQKPAFPVQPELPIKRSIADRLGKRKAALVGDVTVMVNKDLSVESDLPLKRSLAERLGSKVACPEDGEALSKLSVLKPVRERLGLPGDQAAPETAESEAQGRPSAGIRIKTLEEIRLEKAAKSQAEGGSAPPEQAPTVDPPAEQRAARAPAGARIKTFSEILHARKQKRLESEQDAKGATPPHSPGDSKEAAKPVAGGPEEKGPAAVPGAVKVKTLEEIRREKAARMQRAMGNGADAEKTPDATDGAGPGPRQRRILRLPKAPAAGAQNKEKTAEQPQEPGAAAETGADGVKDVSPAETVKVKSFEEIMREKRMRRLQGETVAPPPPVQAPVPSPPSPAKQREEPPQAPTSPRRPATTIRQRPAKVQPVPTPVQQRPSPPAPVRQRITLRQKETAPAVSLARVAAGAPTSLVAKRTLAARGGSVDLAASPFKHTKLLPAAQEGPSPATPAPQPRPGSSTVPESPGDTAPPAPSPAPEEKVVKVEEVVAKVPTPEPKVRPKLNVKPSVVKPAAPVRLGQKRKASEGPRSAIAAVKPLNSAPSASEEAAQEPPCKQTQTTTKTEPETVTLREGTRAPGPLEEAPAAPQAEPQPPPTLEQNPAMPEPTQVSPAATASPAVMSPPARPSSQAKARRLSSTSGRPPAGPASGSAVDDFEELMKEFSDDRLEDDLELDPAKDEDELLLELSEMIGN
ncbi:zinc finger CCCH domain-containing protein 11A isoform X1 [Amia ocellicauda]|uniref:zinc finger CCCH domain-containing protein 11A isoform X1 n=1 Tax=Amia ocellicauda TaxID=2972642 RepID=UPI003463F71C